MLSAVPGVSAAEPCIPGFDQGVIDYWRTVALRSERGDRYARPRRWSGSVLVAVEGGERADDRESLSRVVDDLRPLVLPLRLMLTTDTEGADVVIRYVPRAEFVLYLPDYRGVDLGLFWFDWDKSGAIIRGGVLIADELRGAARSHVLREELTQVLGLPGDTTAWDDSIFYANWSLTQDYSALDRSVIRFHYDATLTDDQRLGGQACKATFLDP